MKAIAARPGPTIIALLVLAATAGCPSADEPARHLLWQVAGETNRVYLLGSVHMLRKSDYPLPAAINEAYEDAERLVMELDMDDLDPAAAQAVMIEKGRIVGNARLADLVGADAWRQAVDDARALGLDLATLQSVEPWLAAMTVINLEMARQGFSADNGLEMHLTRRARTDGKPVDGLETLEHQFGLFDSLPMAVQTRFFLKSLEDAGSIDEDADRIIDAWKRADLATLKAEMADGFEELPTLYEALVTRRNRAWADQVEAFLDSEDDYLVVVGALHLVGDDSVVGLLRQRGLVLRQL